MPPRAKTEAKDGLTKFQRYRRAQADKGMKLLRVWVPDPTRPELARKTVASASAAARPSREAEALTFIEATFPWPDN